MVHPIIGVLGVGVDNDNVDNGFEIFFSNKNNTKKTLTLTKSVTK
jgi:hypothetical protein